MKKIFVVLWLLCASQLNAAPCPEQVVVRNASTWGTVQRTTPTQPRAYAPSYTVMQRPSTASVQIQRNSPTTRPNLSTNDDPYHVVVPHDLAALRPQPPAYSRSQQESAEFH